MRLLKLGEHDNEPSLVEFFGNAIPRYAILSHTWGADHEEVTFKDIQKGAGKGKPGYKKIRFCGKQAARDNLEYFWVDTCCIDKSSSAELSEAINSMFQWYRGSAKCYVYLSDVCVVSSMGDSEEFWKQKPTFTTSRWFTRGWTLQELIAPASVEFFSANEQRLGDKLSLEMALHEITGIAIPALKGDSLSGFDVDERMSWAENRQTKREEDAVYSLLGIFDVHMPLIYGEGRKKALSRLRREIKESLDDQSPTLQLAISSRYGDTSKRQNETTMDPPNLADISDAGLRFGKTSHSISKPQIKSQEEVGVYITRPKEILQMQAFVEEVGPWMDNLDPQHHVRWRP